MHPVHRGGEGPDVTVEIEKISFPASVVAIGEPAFRTVLSDPVIIVGGIRIRIIEGENDTGTVADGEGTAWVPDFPCVVTAVGNGPDG